MGREHDEGRDRRADLRAGSAFSKKEAAELVEKVFEIIKETLAEGEKVKISGFGNFVVRHIRMRGRDEIPQTGQEILSGCQKGADLQTQSRAKELC